MSSIPRHLALACAAGAVALCPVGGAAHAQDVLTASQAESVWVADLARLYREDYTDAARRYVKCANLVTEDDGTQTAECWTEFGTGRDWRLANGTVAMADTGDVTTHGPAFKRHWTRRWRRYGSSCAKSWSVEGTLWSNEGVCPAALAFHYFRGYAYTGGTGTGSFPAVTRYRCKRRSRGTIQCVNHMGDAFRWRR